MALVLGALSILGPVVVLLVVGGILGLGRGRLDLGVGE